MRRIFEANSGITSPPKATNGALLDPPLFAGRAFFFDGTALADIGPITVQDQSTFLGRIAVGELFTGGTNINIVPCYVAEVLLSEAALGYDARCHRLGQRHADTGLLASQNFRAVEIASAQAGANPGSRITTGSSNLIISIFSAERCKVRARKYCW